MAPFDEEHVVEDAPDRRKSPVLLERYVEPTGILSDPVAPLEALVIGVREMFFQLKREAHVSLERFVHRHHPDRYQIQRADARFDHPAIADDPECGDLASAAAAAKLVAADAAIRNAKSCIQVHGGMGFTWEMIPHYLLKRAWVLEQSFGSRTELAETVARQLASEVAS